MESGESRRGARLGSDGAQKRLEIENAKAEQWTKFTEACGRAVALLYDRFGDELAAPLRELSKGLYDFDLATYSISILNSKRAGLILALADDDHAMGMFVEALGGLLPREDVQRKLLALVRSENAAVRVRALRALTDGDSAEAIQALQDGLTDKEDQVRVVALGGLAKKGMSSFRGIAAAFLKEPYGETKRAGMDYLRRFPDEKTAGLIKPLLTDGDPEVRLFASDILRKLADRSDDSVSGNLSGG